MKKGGMTRLYLPLYSQPFSKEGLISEGTFKFVHSSKKCTKSLPEGIYNPITAMGFSAMFTFQLDNTKM